MKERVPALRPDNHAYGGTVLGIPHHHYFDSADGCDQEVDRQGPPTCVLSFKARLLTEDRFVPLYLDDLELTITQKIIESANPAGSHLWLR